MWGGEDSALFLLPDPFWLVFCFGTKSLFTLTFQDAPHLLGLQPPPPQTQADGKPWMYFGVSRAETRGSRYTTGGGVV